MDAPLDALPLKVHEGHFLHVGLGNMESLQPLNYWVGTCSARAE